jgi:hypothetical protein
MIHKHHIIPRHMGGSDDPSNIVKLSVAEHANAHRILFETYGKTEDKIAWLCLSGQIGHEEARLAAYRIGYAKRDKSFFNTEEYKKKISLASKGRDFSNRKKRLHLTEEHKQRISASAMGNQWGVGNKGNPGPRPKVQCPHCKKIGGDGIMTRFHFNNCKKRIQ